MDLSLVIPARNAATFIAPRLRGLHSHLEAAGLFFEIIVVDDGSTDQTTAEVESLHLPGIRRLWLRPEDRPHGKFAAIRRGVAECRGRFVLFTDADIPFRFTNLTDLHEILRRDGFDLVLGDRTLPESVYSQKISLARRIANFGFRRLVRILIGELPDSQCGLKGFKGDVARLLFSEMTETGFAGDVEILYMARLLGLAVKTVPVQLEFEGNSSVTLPRDATRMMAALFRIHGRRAAIETSTKLQRLRRSPTR